MTLEALRGVDFNWTRALHDIWIDPPYHIEDLNKSVADAVLEEFSRGATEPNWSPLGQVIIGNAGSGKTHLVSALRRRVWEANGWFILIDITGMSDFWRTAALSFVNSLGQRLPNGQQQRKAILNAVLRKVFHHSQQRDAANGTRVRDLAQNGGASNGSPLNIFTAGRQFASRMFAAMRNTLFGPPLSELRNLPPLQRPFSQSEAVEQYLAELREFDPSNTQRFQDVVRALIFLDWAEPEISDFAFVWLQGENLDDTMRRRLKFSSIGVQAEEVVRGILWLMGVAGPTMIAIDQIDAVVSNANMALYSSSNLSDIGKANWLLNELAKGLIELHDLKGRALTVVSCLEPTWEILERQAIDTVKYRFIRLPVLKTVLSTSVAERLIGDRVRQACKSAGFTPPYKTWPFLPQAVESAVGMRPRMILIRCDEHRRSCLAKQEVIECESLEVARAAPTGPESPQNGLEARYQAEVAAADPSLFGVDEAADAARLVHICELYLGHLALPDTVDAEVKPDTNRRTAALHAILSFVFRDEQDRQESWCFRWLPQNDARAFQARLKPAMTASGLETGLKSRRLVILRETPPPGGPRTQELVDRALAAGAIFVNLSETDKRAFLALIALADSGADGFENWLRTRRPLFQTSLFKRTGLAPPSFLASPRVPQDAPDTGPDMAKSGASEAVATQPTPSVRPVSAPNSPQLPIGRQIERGLSGASVTLPTSSLSRHIALLAGTGSGKTVLLKRIVEEAALIGIPAIVIDANNNLARLGERWPSLPDSFDAADSAKVNDYFDKCDVVVWTPGMPAGNPMSLSLLPDFGALRADDVLAREQAIEMALATRGEFLPASGRRGKLMSGVLADALTVFARYGGSLEDLVALLADLDTDASKITDATRIAKEIADLLNAEISTNPLLKSGVEPLQLERMFTGVGGRARVSVINLSGLASDVARQDFVNRLQMALFTWIKRNPSPTGRLYVLDEAQNFAPSVSTTACKASALALVAQARKYGLGMIFATDQPKGVDHAIVSNCATHFYGRVASPTAIQAIQEMMAAKGGGGDDIGRLTAGEFYFATDGGGRPFKIKAPMCLSWHPSTPPTAEEVAEIAVRIRAPAVS